MKILDGIIISLRDIKRRKLRSILTIIAISVGSMLLVKILLNFLLFISLKDIKRRKLRSILNLIYL